MPASAAPMPAVAPSPPPRLPVARPSMPLAEALEPYLERIDEAGWYSNFGPLLRDFEHRLAARFRVPAFVATAANGTLAMTLALQAIVAEPGGFCAMPAWTFVATAHAAMQAGLVPWFVDVDPDTWMLDPATLANQLWAAPGRISAVVPVAAFGRVPDLAAWTAFREETGIPVLLDAAAAFDGLEATPIPAMVSLHATKALGVGEGGFVVAPDAMLATAVRQRSSFGFLGDRESLMAATNAKLSEYAAAVGLAALDAWPATRLRYMRAAQLMRIALAARPEIVFQEGWGYDWVASACVVRLPDGAAEAAEARLHEAGIESRRWWGNGCHRSPAFADAPRTELPVTDLLARSTLGLPYAASMTPDDARRVAGALGDALSRG
jgi:dTDP-4-amino-4,6-dideoxygalactose transaminase